MYHALAAQYVPHITTPPESVGTPSTTAPPRTERGETGCNMAAGTTGPQSTGTILAAHSLGVIRTLTGEKEGDGFASSDIPRVATYNNGDPAWNAWRRDRETWPTPLPGGHLGNAAPSLGAASGPAEEKGGNGDGVVEKKGDGDDVVEERRDGDGNGDA